MVKEEKPEYVISFPHLGNYYVPVYVLLRNLFENAKIMIPEKITKKTIELGDKYAPEFICTPFKYNLGNFVESLDAGANVIIQAGGGCRFGYYAEVQEQILRDLGYKFSFITLFDSDGVDVVKVYKKFKQINPKLKFSRCVKFFLLVVKMTNMLDELEETIRKKISYEKNKGTLENIHKQLLEELKTVKSMKELYKINIKYTKLIDEVELENIEKNKLRVGIVGELYTSMEPFSSFFLESEMAKMGVDVKRYTTATYLLFQKGRKQSKLLQEAKGYIKYALGADGTESVAHSIELCKKGYDGIIHIKPFGCTPEINAMPILQKVSQDYGVPIIYFTFDTQTSETGIKTRLEAFYDMLKMKKEVAL